MARDDTPLEQETFERVLAEEGGKGAARRVAGAAARAAALRAARAKSGERGTTATPAPSTPAGDGGAPNPPRRPQLPLRPRPLLRPPLRARRRPCSGRDRDATAPERRRPAPTGTSRAEEGAPEKTACWRSSHHRGDPASRTRAGDRINVWPHLLTRSRRDDDSPRARFTIFSTFVNAAPRAREPNLTPTRRRRPGTSSACRSCLRYFPPWWPACCSRRRSCCSRLRWRRSWTATRAPARRPQDRDHAVHDADHVRGESSPSSDRSSAAPATMGLAVGPGGLLRAMTPLLAISSGTPPSSS